jgi:uncharacterized membrane-anchored protein YhcB (DUF1043 family)
MKRLRKKLDQLSALIELVVGDLNEAKEVLDTIAREHEENLRTHNALVSSLNVPNNDRKDTNVLRALAEEKFYSV